jgi:hypothetical protein
MRLLTINMAVYSHVLHVTLQDSRWIILCTVIHVPTEEAERSRGDVYVALRFYTTGYKIDRCSPCWEIVMLRQVEDEN